MAINTKEAPLFTARFSDADEVRYRIRAIADATGMKAGAVAKDALMEYILKSEKKLKLKKARS